MLLYQVGRGVMRIVFLTAVAAEHSGTQHVVREFSETLSTLVALKQCVKYDLKSVGEKQMG